MQDLGDALDLDLRVLFPVKPGLLISDRPRSEDERSVLVVPLEQVSHPCRIVSGEQSVLLQQDRRVG